MYPRKSTAYLILHRQTTTKYKQGVIQQQPKLRLIARIFNNSLKVCYFSSINLWYGVSEDKYSALLCSDPAISLASTTHKYLQQLYIDERVGEIGCLYRWWWCIRLHQVGHLFGYFSFSPTGSVAMLAVYTPQSTNDATIRKTCLSLLLLSAHLSMNMIFLRSLLAIYTSMQHMHHAAIFTQ